MKRSWVIWIVFSICGLLLGLWLKRETEKRNQYVQNQIRAAYRDGWESAVLMCEQSNILKGPLTIVGGTLSNCVLYVVRIDKSHAIKVDSSDLVGNTFLFETHEAIVAGGRGEE